MRILDANTAEGVIDEDSPLTCVSMGFSCSDPSVNIVSGPSNIDAALQCWTPDQSIAAMARAASGSGNARYVRALMCDSFSAPLFAGRGLSMETSLDTEREARLDMEHCGRV